MNEEKFAKWLMELVQKLDYPSNVINMGGDTVGYTYNRKTKTLRFLNEKEARKLRKKNIVWKRLGEDWIFPKQRQKSK